jgi:hypothetical protein
LGRTARGWLLGICLALAAAGCVPSLPAGTAAVSAPVQLPDSSVKVTLPPACPAEKVTVTDVRWFQDSEGAWRISGWIENAWDQPVSKILTEVEALDSAGRVVDHGEDVSNYPLNLQPGAQAPFSAWIKREFPGVARFVVAVDECIVAEQMERRPVEVRGGRLSFDAAGRAQVTAELANTGDRTVLVNGLMAAVFDAEGLPLATDNASVVARYLAPGEHGPVRVTLDLPDGGQALARSYRLFMDPVVVEPRLALLDAARDLRVTSRYVDDKGRFHLAGEVTNRTRDSVTLRLQATLYEDAAKSSVLDAAFWDTAVPLAPGETRSFDFVNWGPINARSEGAGEQVSRMVAEEIRVEPFQSWKGEPAPAVAVTRQR